MREIILSESVKIIVLLICCIQFSWAENSSSVRSYSARWSSFLPTNEGVVLSRRELLKAPPFTSRFFREGDVLIEVPARWTRLQHQTSRAVFNETTSRLVVLAEPGEHWGIETWLGEKMCSQFYTTVRVLEFPKILDVNFKLAPGEYPEGTKEIKRLELSGLSYGAFGSSVDGNLLLEGDVDNLMEETVSYMDFRITSKIPGLRFNIKSECLMAFDVPAIWAVFRGKGEKTYGIELLIERVQLDGSLVSDWLLVEETGRPPTNPFLEHGDEYFRFEEKLPDGRVRRSLGQLRDWDRFIPERQVNNPDLGGGDPDPFSNEETLPEPPLLYMGDHPFLRNAKRSGLIDATEILKKSGVELGPDDFAVIEGRDSMFLVETKAENFEIIEKWMMEESYGIDTLTLVELVLVSSVRKVDSAALGKKGVKTVGKIELQVGDVDDNQGEFDFGGFRGFFEIWRGDRLGAVEIELDLRSGQVVKKKVTLKKDSWIIITQIERDGEWLAWVARMSPNPLKS